MQIENRAFIVTGGASGLGEGTARMLAAAGGRVVVADLQADKGEAVAREIGGAFVRCDVTSEESCRNAVEKVVEAYGRIDILLNNAGVAVRGGVDTLSEADWDRCFATNVTGMFHVSKYVVPRMRERGYGKIVNIASVNAVIADKQDVFIRHAYNASKAAVLGLTKGMACSYARDGITVNAVGPGLFASEMTESTLFRSEEFLTAYNALNPAGRPGGKGELNGTILYLSSDASSYVQGQLILVDGGMTLV